MSFSIERYKEESKTLDTAGIAWDAVAADGLLDAGPCLGPSRPGGQDAEGQPMTWR